ncbi:hypothetical protein COF68_17655 [Bacillus toyonensis]|uniref:hypothetical protein n=1 Tax=Bacillus toyonensis TaxID=155322 RepID=UPI000BED147E|nr:hypothetical protein [Bacillus toyonensis]PEB24402.1 hypothetical protein COO05_11865 [Bacillus toyonensis]PHE61125.1 hypothetical protein COF68_17655 [Bacillus toyonensis]
MNIDQDKLTSYLYKAIDIMLLQKPERTAYGIVLGFFLVGAKDGIAELTTGNVKNAIRGINTVGALCLGILLARIDIIFKRETVNKEVITKMNTLKAIIKEGEFTQKEKRNLYRDFIQNISSDLDLGSNKKNDKAKEQSS